jgi:Family of unknown function (DUF6130)
MAPRTRLSIKAGSIAVWPIAGMRCGRSRLDQCRRRDEEDGDTIHTASNVFVFAGVKPGKHKIELELVHSNHPPLKTGVEKTVEFTVAEK